MASAMLLSATLINPSAISSMGLLILEVILLKSNFDSFTEILLLLFCPNDFGNIIFAQSSNSKDFDLSQNPFHTAHCESLNLQREFHEIY